MKSRQFSTCVYGCVPSPIITAPIIFSLRFYLQCTIMGPLEGGDSCLALSTSCTSSRRGGALSGVFWSGHEVYQYCCRLRSSSPHWYTQTHQHTHRQAWNMDVTIFKCSHLHTWWGFMISLLLCMCIQIVLSWFLLLWQQWTQSKMAKKRRL